MAQLTKFGHSSSHFAVVAACQSSLQHTQSSILSPCPHKDWHCLHHAAWILTLKTGIELSAGDIWERGAALTMPQTCHVLLRTLIAAACRCSYQMQMLLNCAGGAAAAHATIHTLLNVQGSFCCYTCHAAESAKETWLLRIQIADAADCAGEISAAG